MTRTLVNMPVLVKSDMELKSSKPDIKPSSLPRYENFPPVIVNFFFGGGVNEGRGKHG